MAARSQRRKRFALEMGATDFIEIGVHGGAEGDSDVEEATERSIHASLGGPPDVVFECAGFAGAMMQSMTWVRPKGTLVAMGYGLHPEEATTAIPLWKELRVQFSMT